MRARMHATWERGVDRRIPYRCVRPFLARPTHSPHRIHARNSPKQGRMGMLMSGVCLGHSEGWKSPNTGVCIVGECLGSCDPGHVAPDMAWLLALQSPEQAHAGHTRGPNGDSYGPKCLHMHVICHNKHLGSSEYLPHGCLASFRVVLYCFWPSSRPQNIGPFRAVKRLPTGPSEDLGAQTLSF